MSSSAIGDDMTLDVETIIENVNEENTCGAGAAAIESYVSVRSEWSPSDACCCFDLNLECIGRVAALAIESESSSGAANVTRITEHVGEESWRGLHNSVRAYDAV